MGTDRLVVGGAVLAVLLVAACSRGYAASPHYLCGGSGKPPAYWPG